MAEAVAATDPARVARLTARAKRIAQLTSDELYAEAVAATDPARTS